MHSTKSVILSLLPTGCHSSAHQLIRPLIEVDNRRGRCTCVDFNLKCSQNYLIKLEREFFKNEAPSSKVVRACHLSGSVESNKINDYPEPD